VKVSVVVSDPGSVEVAIVDVSGRIRREILRGPLAAGRYELEWDGRGAGGQSLASGVYFVRVVLPRGEQTARLVLVR
jgi:hypothetical protein